MLRHELTEVEQPVSLLPRDKTSCLWISDVIILQCILVLAGAATITYCVWSPEHSKYDYDKLARIMYLYDPHACGYNLRASRSIITLEFSNETYGLNVRPIKYTPAIVTVSTRLSAKTRKFIKYSIVIHSYWMIVAILLRIFRFATKLRVLKFILNLSFYSSVFVISFDMSMAVLYISHIQQSLTTGMILRYSGWSVEMKLSHYNRFGGWFPMIAAICWMRGIIIFALNVYICRVISLMKQRIWKREVKKKLMLEDNLPVPEPKYDEHVDQGVLYYRTGEYKPVTKKTYMPLFF